MSIAPLDVADATAETLLGATAAAATDDEDVMPPRDAKEKLTPPQIALLPKPAPPPRHTLPRTP